MSSVNKALALAKELSEDFEKVIANRRAQQAIRRTAYGLSPTADSPEGLDPANAQILRLVKPRDSEVAMLMAEHANWARREALKALSLASSDAAKASDAAGRANAEVLEALRQPASKSNFVVYKERPLPGEPWFAGPRLPARDHGGTLLPADAPRGINLKRLSDWFEKHPRPPASPEVPRIIMKSNPGVEASKAISDSGWEWEGSASAGPVPFLESSGNQQAVMPPADSVGTSSANAAPGLESVTGAVGAEGAAAANQPLEAGMSLSPAVLTSYSILAQVSGQRKVRRRPPFELGLQFLWVPMVGKQCESDRPQRHDFAVHVHDS